VLDRLVASPDEVGGIFEFPLLSCLTGHLDERDRGRYVLAEQGGPNWPYQEDFHVSGARMEFASSHCLLTWSLTGFWTLPPDAIRCNMDRHGSVQDEQIQDERYAVGEC
jgi:hypothetical protein